jgi:predicted DNA-binding transcriptional regulator YafY
MDRTERFYKIDQLIRARGVVSFDTLLAELEVSRATLKRDLQYLRDRLQLPIVHDRDAGGYRREHGKKGGTAPVELPGLWFSAQEIHALLTMQHLLSNLDKGGLLGPHVAPLMERLGEFMRTPDGTVEEIRQRVRIIGLAARPMPLAHFEKVGSALLGRQRLRITYHARGTDETTVREVSPQRLVHYRENWYLDAWCHLREGLRSFAVDAIQQADIMEKKAKDITVSKLDQILGSGYGIFSGTKLQWARLKFSPARSRWVAVEAWHPRQKGRWLKDGAYELEIPYADDRELVMDILKHGPECEVLGPSPLRQKVAAALEAARGLYA